MGPSGQIAHSSDGETWTEVNRDTTPFYRNPDYRGIDWLAYGNGKFVAASAYKIMAQSTDGESWASMTWGWEWDVTISNLAFLNGKFFAWDRQSIWTSTDGVTWEAATVSGLTNAGADQIQAIA